ncbi:MAG: YheV family putative zinc ribbon protein [Enterobacterales bacterium]
MISNIKKKFISGAICPLCNKEDTLLVLFNNENIINSVSCVECNFYKKSNFNEIKSIKSNKINFIYLK